jgi:DNA-binding FrmR family transcriptional regulator
MKDLGVRIFRRVIALCTAFAVIFSGLVSPAHADDLSELQDNLKAANSVLAARNSQYSELTQLLQDNVAALDNLNKRIVENQNQTNGAIISITLDEELQAKKKALEKIILDRSDQSKSIADQINAITKAINSLKLKIERSQNGGTVSAEEDPESTPAQTTKKVTGVSPNCPVGFTQIDAVGNSNGSITITCTTRTEVPKIQQSINYAYAGRLAQSKRI